MKSTERFSSRVDNYTKYRPSYPHQILDLLRTECSLAHDATIADIGSGTGILTQLLLDKGYLVYAVEPNKEMREEAERLLSDNPNFHSVLATAESTTLPGHSIDLVTAGQAFHWFDPEGSKAEFARILKPNGTVALIWNHRKDDATPFLAAYNDLLRTYCPEYGEVKHTRIGHEDIAALFGEQGYKEAQFENKQLFDYEGLEGRLLSSSYTPQPDHPNYQPMLSRLHQIFTQYKDQGYVLFEYITRVYYGRIHP